MRQSLSSSDLKWKVTIERFAKTGTDEMNAPIGEWSVLGVRSAWFEAVTDGERAQAGELAAAATSRFRIWRQSAPDLSPKDRLIFEGVVHDIEHVKPIGFNEAWEITAKARADGE